MDIIDAIKKHHDRTKELSEVLTTIALEDQEALEMICAEIQKELHMHENAAEKFYLNLLPFIDGDSFVAQKTAQGDCERLLKDICQAQDEISLKSLCGKLQERLYTYHSLENQTLGWSASHMDEIQLENWGRKYLLKKKQLSRALRSSPPFLKLKKFDLSGDLFSSYLSSFKMAYFS